MDGALQHDPGDAGGDHQLLDRDHLPAGHLPRHRPGPTAARERQLPPLDADGVPGRQRRPGGRLRPPRRHLRPGQDVQRRLPDLHPGLDRPGPHPRRGLGGGARADRAAHRPGGRRGPADGQLHGHPHRRLPCHRARHGPGDQPGGGAGRLLHGAADRRAAGRHQLAGRLPGQRPVRDLRDRLGATSSCARSASAARAASTGPATSPSASG